MLATRSTCRWCGQPVPLPACLCAECERDLEADTWQPEAGGPKEAHEADG